MCYQFLDHYLYGLPSEMKQVLDYHQSCTKNLSRPGVHGQPSQNFVRPGRIRDLEIVRGPGPARSLV